MLLFRILLRFSGEFFFGFLLFAWPLDVAAEGLLANDPLPPVCSYEVLNRFKHDPASFTQGLCFAGGMLYEGTGLYGQSSLRRMSPGGDPEMRLLPPRLFGEGVTVFKDRVIQLTWKSGIGLVWNRDKLQLERFFTYLTEGWGITHDGSQLIMSDGSATLYFLDPHSFSLKRRITVVDRQEPVYRLNELEYIRGEIWANIWKDNRIALIDPETGRVTAWVDLSHLVKEEDGAGFENVLNGIAYDAMQNRIFVTGKRWHHIYEIQVDDRCGGLESLP